MSRDASSLLPVSRKCTKVVDNSIAPRHLNVFIRGIVPKTEIVTPLDDVLEVVLIASWRSDYQHLHARARQNLDRVRYTVGHVYVHARCNSVHVRAVFTEEDFHLAFQQIDTLVILYVCMSINVLANIGNSQGKAPLSISAQCF